MNNFKTNILIQTKNKFNNFISHLEEIENELLFDPKIYEYKYTPIVIWFLNETNLKNQLKISLIFQYNKLT